MTQEKQYEQGIVTFLDLLGFRDLLQTKSPGELSRILSLFRSQGNPKVGSGDEFNRMFEYAALSDCFFRTTATEHEINRKFPTGHLFHELLGIIFVQCHLLVEGHLIRGAVTYGEYCAERDDYGAVLFGPAVAKAYELESKQARYPRVVVDPHLIEQFWQSELLKNVIHDHHTEWDEYLSHLLCQDDNGVWFVDYLRGINGNFDEEPEGTATFYLKHKRFIEQRLQQWVALKKPGPDSISEKLIWLLQYHNSMLKGFADPEWEWLLSSADGSLGKEDFIINPPKHPLFNRYPPA